MTQRFSGNTMNLQHFHDFYFLEALQAELVMAQSAHPDWQFKHSVTRLEADVKEAFTELCNEMALRIYVYLWSASLGEARHARSMGLPLSTKELSGYDRHNVYNLSLDYFPSDENVKLIKDIFDQEWGGAYGGKAWLSIVEGMEMYGKVSNATFIDHAVDLEHNGGCVFNKSANFGLDCSEYNAVYLKRFLDYKFSKNILEDMKDFRSEIKVSRKVYRLIERYMNTCLTFGTGKHVRTLVSLQYIKPELEWLKDYSVEWDTKTLTPLGEKKVKKTTVKKTEVKKYDGGNYGRHVSKIVVGRRYIAHFNGHNVTPAWVSGMDEKEGRKIVFTYVNPEGYGLCGSYLYNREWVYPYKKSEENNDARDDAERRERRDTYRCGSCGYSYSIDEMSYSQMDGCSYCDSCYSDKFVTCGKCMEEMYVNDAVDCSHHHKYYHLCRSCAHEEMQKCDMCMEWHEYTIETKDDGDTLCSSCAESKYCSRCGEYYYDIEKHNENRHERNENG